MLNCLDSAEPDLGPNCLQKLSADNKSWHLQENSWFCLFEETIFQLNRDGSFWVEPVLS